MRKVAIGLWAAVFLCAGIFAAAWWTTRQPEPASPGRPPAPTTLPDIELEDLAGNPRALRDWSGRTLLINFWATWCAPCREEMPLLEQLQQSMPASSLQVIGIAVDRPEPVLRFVGETGVTYPNLLGEAAAGRAAEAFGDAYAGVLPFSVVVAPDGSLLLTRSGVLNRADLSRIAAVAERLASGDLDSAAARGELSAAAP
jgi:thiol-disulfide isomerase/thioredoxin